MLKIHIVPTFATLSAKIENDNLTIFKVITQMHALRTKGISFS